MGSGNRENNWINWITCGGTVAERVEAPVLITVPPHEFPLNLIFIIPVHFIALCGLEIYNSHINFFVFRKFTN
jgi:hypothetical protein